jgi:hypothetical protein
MKSKKVSWMCKHYKECQGNGSLFTCTRSAIESNLITAENSGAEIRYFEKQPSCFRKVK